MSRSWDVFCKVVDNYGDAAVCWRLARQLADEHAGRVRLWIDDLEPLHALCPDVAVGRAQQRVAGVEVRGWDAATAFGTPANIAIDAFGAGLPDAYVAAMVLREPHSLWIILEYLSAETWVGAHHKMPSPHPRLPLGRYFFFPGFVPGTGGVLRERTYAARRAAFEADPVARVRFWSECGFDAPDPSVPVVSLFGYENPRAADFLGTLADGDHPVLVAVTHSRLQPDVRAFFGADPGRRAILRSGNLEARFLPFMPQIAYDELLWASDWNFVRGEDSFVRAQWAGRPLVWQIYPQQEQAHLVKLGAFLDLYCAGLSAPVAMAMRDLWSAWNATTPQASESMRSSWAALLTASAEVRTHATGWVDRLARSGEFAGNLVRYCEERLK